MKSKRLALAAAAFTLTLTAIPAQPAAAGPAAAAKQKVERAVENVCGPGISELLFCLDIAQIIKIKLGI
jgi:hypothetical protein